MPASRSRSKSGDSSIVERANQTAPASAAPTRKGMRQPQLCRSASDSRLTVSAATADREQRADLARRRRERGDQPAPLGPRAFEQVGDHPGVFAADREPHHAAQGEQQPRRPPAPICAWVGSSAVASIASRHHRHRQQQHRPPPAPVADMAEHHRADRPHQVGDREPAERRRQRSLAAAEEHPRQHGGEVEVEREVVPLDHGRERRDHDRLVRDAVAPCRHRTRPRRAIRARPAP